MHAITLPSNLRASLRAGHPWIYRDHVPQGLTLESGAWVALRCGDWQGYGLWDVSSPIAVRVFSMRGVPDARWVQQRIAAAWELRAAIRERQPTTAYRWLFGEGDGIPGVTVDLYGDYAVMQTYADSLETIVPWVVEGLQRTTRLRGILRRRRASLEDVEDHNAGQGKVELLWGKAPAPTLVVEEHGLKFRANLFEGQKTGLFLDHRENRHLIEGWSAGLRVLNCFSYTGAFSVYAARGGAAQVTSIDIAPAAAADARENFKLNGFDPELHEFLAEDVFEALERYGQQRRQFDLIILDPPSFAKSRKHQQAAIRAYTRVNRQALRLLAPGGMLASASCTSQVSPEDFRAMLASAASAEGLRLRILHDAGQPIDHPVPAHFPEGRYLKFMLCAAEKAL